MLNITSGRVARPQKLVLYGVEGIGKTSLAAQTPEPLFIDTEGGTAHLDVRRLQKPATWDELIALIKEVAAMMVRNDRDYDGNGGTGIYNSEGATPATC